VKTAELIELAFDHHRAGDLGRAEALYREILAADACDLNALHLLGALMADRGHAQDAVVLLERAEAALRARGGAGAQHAALYYNLGRALAAVGRGATRIIRTPLWTVSNACSHRFPPTRRPGS
jgi:tetratricopeptide (TPR) repeat protein